MVSLQERSVVEIHSVARSSRCRACVSGIEGLG